MEDLLRMARMHGETTDTRRWVDNLERMVAVAWDLMTDEQRNALRGHGDVLAIAGALDVSDVAETARHPRDPRCRPGRR